jgi:hypothetical protein
MVLADDWVFVDYARRTFQCSGEVLAAFQNRSPRDDSTFAQLLVRTHRPGLSMLARLAQCPWWQRESQVGQNVLSDYNLELSKVPSDVGAHHAQLRQLLAVPPAAAGPACVRGGRPACPPAGPAERHVSES